MVDYGLANGWTVDSITSWDWYGFNNPGMT